MPHIPHRYSCTYRHTSCNQTSKQLSLLSVHIHVHVYTCTRVFNSPRLRLFCSILAGCLFVWHMLCTCTCTCVCTGICMQIHAHTLYMSCTYMYMYMYIGTRPAHMVGGNSDATVSIITHMHMYRQEVKTRRDEAKRLGLSRASRKVYTHIHVHVYVHVHVCIVPQL